MADPSILPPQFPPLPNSEPPWPENVTQAHAAVAEVYERSILTGRQDEASRPRLEAALDRCLEIALPILLALFQAAVGHDAWQALCITLFERVVACLVQAIHLCDGR